VTYSPHRDDFVQKCLESWKVCLRSVFGDDLEKPRATESLQQAALCAMIIPILGRTEILLYTIVLI
jgi:hypothetical protein